MTTIPKQKLWARLAALGAAALLIMADQLIKAAMPQDSRVLIPRVLGLRHTLNYGISFSLFGESAAIMTVISIVTGLALLAGIAAILMGKLRGRILPGAVMILAGGMGNLIDRLLHGYVVDYFEFLFVRFAIFNFADVLITCGAAWLVIWVLISEARSCAKAKPKAGKA